MADITGKGSGEQFNIDVVVNLSQAQSAIANVSQSLNEITKKIGEITNKIIDLQSRL